MRYPGGELLLEVVALVSGALAFMGVGAALCVLAHVWW
jgi:hypothetical protein